MKHLDASFKHTLDLIRVKNNSVVLSIFDAIQDSSKYRFADDGASSGLFEFFFNTVRMLFKCKCCVYAFSNTSTLPYW